MSVFRSATLLAVWLFANSASATLLRYEAALHEASWLAESSPLVCRLSHDIGLYGKAEFVRYAGRGIYLSINVDQDGPRAGKAHLRALAPAWQHSTASQDLGAVRYRGGRDPFRFSSTQVKRVLASLEQGLRPSLHYHSLASSGADEVEVILSAINFHDRLSDFRSCMAGLISLDYKLASNSNISFANGGFAMDTKARRRLDAIAAFVKHDAAIKRVRIEGYSDNVGSRGDNYTLSRERARVVREYLIARNVPVEKISFDYYGEHKPLNSNRTAKGRATNRRVLVQLLK